MIDMKQPYIELLCEDYQDINEGIVNYLRDCTDILKKDPRKDPTINIPYANFVNTVDFVKQNPKLIKYLSKLGMSLYHVYYAVAWQPTKENKEIFYKDFKPPNLVSSCPIHLDRPPVQWKMNWPVLNMIGTGTRFYQLTDPNDDINKYIVRSGVAGSLNRDVWNLPYEPFVETHRHIFGPAPILMNGLVPHDVWFSEKKPMPRIGLQMMFFKEPRHLLTDDCIILN